MSFVRAKPGKKTMSWNVPQIISDGFTYDIIKLLLTSFGISAAISFLGNYFKRLESAKDLIYAFGTSFFIVFLLLFVVMPKAQGPQLAGGIQQIISGPLSPSDDRNTISVITMSVLNSGTSQSVAKNWQASIKIDGQTYQGSFLSPPPKDFTFNNAKYAPGEASSITYHGSDDLLEKSSGSPIPSGGMVTGILFVIFKDISVTSVRSGAEFTVRYEDALSHQYSSTSQVTAKPPAISSVPGLHADLVCPAPPGNFSPKPPSN